MESFIFAYGLITRTYTFEKDQFGCAECMGEKSDCPHCKGTGWIPLSEVDDCSDATQIEKYLS